MKSKALKAAFPHTLPVFMGYIFLGIAFGILISSKGYSVWWALLASVFVYAGSMQFVMVDILTTAFNPLSAVLMTLMVNARHIFYGLSMLGKFKSIGKFKPYMIFSLTDETYSILCSTEPPEGVDRRWFMFFISVLDQLYWVTGSLIGAAAGTLITFDSTGIDFAMTALFIVIFVEQWEKAGNMRERIPALIGVGLTAMCRLIFGKDSFIVFAMVGIFLCLSLMRPVLDKREGDNGV